MPLAARAERAPAMAAIPATAITSRRVRRVLGDPGGVLEIASGAGGGRLWRRAATIAVPAATTVAPARAPSAAVAPSQPISVPTGSSISTVSTAPSGRSLDGTVVPGAWRAARPWPLRSRRRDQVLAAARTATPATPPVTAPATCPQLPSAAVAATSAAAPAAVPTRTTPGGSAASSAAAAATARAVATSRHSPGIDQLSPTTSATAPKAMAVSASITTTRAAMVAPQV